MKLRQLLRKTVPEDTDEEVLIKDIVVPNDFKKTRPAQWKIKRIRHYYNKYKRLDKSITVIAETNERGKNNKFVLVDGYTRYIFSRYILRLDVVPVKYISFDEYLLIENK